MRKLTDAFTSNQFSLAVGILTWIVCIYFAVRFIGETMNPMAIVIVTTCTALMTISFASGWWNRRKTGASPLWADRTDPGERGKNRVNILICTMLTAMVVTINLT